MLDMYDFWNDVWLCHSFEGTCYEFTAFVSDRPNRELNAGRDVMVDSRRKHAMDGSNQATFAGFRAEAG